MRSFIIKGIALVFGCGVVCKALLWTGSSEKDPPKIINIYSENIFTTLPGATLAQARHLQLCHIGVSCHRPDGNLKQ